MSAPKIFIGGRAVDLTQNHYKGAGGEGAIYVKGSKAFKIYHDQAKVIPAGKIAELAKLQMPNVLAPTEMVADSRGRDIGFVMPFVDKTEYLCKLFTRGFRDTNHVSPEMIKALVGRMRDTLAEIHAKDILVVDYNELNFLTDRSFQEVFHIDVDSYQTPHYHATAIMESIRDRQIKGHKWTKESDWFSFGIIAFQLFMSSHPYKGRHPDYGRDWQKMMDAGVSVFNRATRLPPNTQDWAVVPPGYLKWFEKIFEHGDRLPPPAAPDSAPMVAGPVKAQIIASTQRFALTTLHEYPDDILAFRYIGPVAYACTKSGMFADHKLIKSWPAGTGYTSRRLRRDVCAARGALPVMLAFDPLRAILSYESLDGQLSGSFPCEGFFVAHERLYLVTPKGLVEYSFMNLGAKTLLAQEVVAQVFHTHQVFDGIVVQDILNTCRIAFPTGPGKTAALHIKELDGRRIISAKYQKGFAIFIVETQGSFQRIAIAFDRTFRAYTLREQENVPIQEVEFAVLDKGLCVAANEDTVEVFCDNETVKVVDDSPLTGTQSLVAAQNQILLIHKRQVLKMGMQ